MPTTNFFMPAERFQFPQRAKEQSSYAERRRLITKLRSNIEPEQSLWNLSMKAASRNFGKVELIAFLFFGVLGGAATVYSLSELFDLLNSGALDQTVQVLLAR